MLGKLPPSKISGVNFNAPQYLENPQSGEPYNILLVNAHIGGHSKPAPCIITARKLQAAGAQVLIATYAMGSQVRFYTVRAMRAHMQNVVIDNPQAGEHITKALCPEAGMGGIDMVVSEVNDQGGGRTQPLHIKNVRAHCAQLCPQSTLAVYTQNEDAVAYFAGEGESLVNGVALRTGRDSDKTVCSFLLRAHANAQQRLAGKPTLPQHVEPGGIFEAKRAAKALEEANANQSLIPGHPSLH